MREDTTRTAADGALASARRRKRKRARIYPRVAAELAERLTRHATASGITETAIVEAALEQYLDRTGDMTLVLRRLDRNGRAHARTQRDLGFLSEAFAIFVKLWFAHTPSIPDAGRQTARMMAETRYRKWLDRVIEQFAGGHRLVDDLPREPVGEDEELSAIALEGSDGARAPAADEPRGEGADDGVSS